MKYIDKTGFWAADGSDERFKYNNPIVYQSISTLSETWVNLDNLEKNPNTPSELKNNIGQMKADVNILCNEIRNIGDRMIVDDVSLPGVSLNSSEKVIYNSNKSKGNNVVFAGGTSSIGSLGDKDYRGDGNRANAIKHATWNGQATILTGDVNYVKLFTDAHEYGYSVNTETIERLKHTDMDIFNNGVGRYQATLAMGKTKDQDMAIRLLNAAIIQRADVGGLRIIKW